MRMPRWTLTGLALLVLLAVIAAPALAADDAHGEKRELIVPAWAEIVAAIITFIILVLLLTKLAWKPILNGLQQREETIRKALDDAQKANEEALALLSEYGEKLEGAKTEARQIADDARKDADAARARIEDDARVRAEETLTRSLKEIEQAKDAARAELLGDVTSIAAEAASRIVRKVITPEDNQKLVDDVVGEFEKNRAGGAA